MEDRQVRLEQLMPAPLSGTGIKGRDVVTRRCPGRRGGR